jgi:hypothetical protein
MESLRSSRSVLRTVARYVAALMLPLVTPMPPAYAQTLADTFFGR